VTPVDDIKNILPPWLMECIQEKNAPAEATGGSLARFVKRIRSMVSKKSDSFYCGQFHEHKHFNKSNGPSCDQINA
jgi:hypothetical protein